MNDQSDIYEKDKVQEIEIDLYIFITYKLQIGLIIEFMNIDDGY